MTAHPVAAQHSIQNESIIDKRLSTPTSFSSSYSPVRRNLNLHIDLPLHGSFAAASTERDKFKRHNSDDMHMHATRPNGTTWRSFDYEKSVPMSPREEVLRARLEQALNKGKATPLVANADSARKSRSQSLSRVRAEDPAMAMEASGSLFGWFFRDEGPLPSHLPPPPPKTAPADQTSFFASPQHQGRPRSRTQPPASSETLMDPRSRSRAVESLSIQQKRAQSLARSSTREPPSPVSPVTPSTCSRRSGKSFSSLEPPPPLPRLDPKSASDTLLPDPGLESPLITPPPTPPQGKPPSRVYPRESLRNHRRSSTTQGVMSKTITPPSREEEHRHHRRTLSNQERPGASSGTGARDVHSPSYPFVAPDPTNLVIVDNPARFNIRTANAQCRAQEGYVSFASVEGLGEPEGDDDENDATQERKKKWLLF